MITMQASIGALYASNALNETILNALYVANVQWWWITSLAAGQAAEMYCQIFDAYAVPMIIK